MIKEEIFLIQILGNFVQQRETSFIDGIDWEKLYSISKKHQLTPIVYYQLRNNQDVILNFKNDFYRQIYQHQMRISVDKEAETVLSDFDYAFIKGRVVSALYPVPSLRTMVDSDILIKEENAEEIYDCLINAGFKEIDKYKEVFSCSKQGLTYEIHSALIEDKPEREKYKRYFDSVWEHYYAEDHTLEKNYHFVYMIMHLRDHFIGCGVGFRQFMDLAIVMKEEELNWSFITEALKNLGLLEFAKRVLALNELWFEVKSPFNGFSINKEFVDNAAKLIMNHGVFGSVSREQDGFWIAKYATEKGVSYKRAKLAVFLRSIFPSYQTVVSLPYCSYVKGKKWMMPVAWIHRALVRLPQKEHRKSFKHRNFYNNEKLFDRLETMNEWGLH